MSNDFRLGTLDQLIDFRNGKSIKKSDGGIPIYGGNGVLGYADKSNYENTLIIGRVGAYCGSIHIEKNKCWISDNAIAGLPKNGYNNEYNYYLLKSLRLNEQRIGSSQPLLTQGILNNIQVRVQFNPKLQQKIAAVLSALDAKIDCNNRINTELEAMAKTLYDYWFVQFDYPFDFASGKPAQNGKPYKSSGGKMVYNSTLKREIPAGWQAGVASDLFDFNPPLSLSANTEASYIDMNSLPVTGFMTNPPELKLFAGGMKFQNGDVVVARITPCLENGKTALISLLRDGEVGFGSTEFIVIRGKKSSLSAFAAQLSRSASFRQFAISNMTGTSGRKRIDAGTLETFSLPLPPKEFLLKYEKTAASFLKRLTNNAQENQHLTQLRDWLLPMLMNGQVKVK